MRFPQVEVINHCSKPPRGLVQRVQRSLRLLAPGDLEGLAAIILLDSTVYASEDPEWHNKDYEKGSPVYGWYVHKNSDIPRPYIVLNVHHIYRYIPSFLWWSALPTLRIIRNLSHEVAHHIVAERGYLFQLGEAPDKPEELADQYAHDTLNKIVRTNWCYRLAHWLSKEIAFWHYAQGIFDFRDNRFLSAANHFYAAWELDPELPEVSEYYWQARDAKSFGQEDAQNS